MKALLYKDFCLITRKTLLFLLVALILLLPPLIFTTPDFLLCMTPLLGLPAPFLLTSYDERSKWAQYARMLPYSFRALALSRCLISWGVTLLMAALSFLACVFYSPGHQVSTATLLALGWLSAGVLLAQAISFPFLFRVGVIHGQVISLAVLLAGIIVVLNILWNVSITDPWSALPGFLHLLAPSAPAVLLLAVAANVVSVFACIRQCAFGMG